MKVLKFIGVLIILIIGFFLIAGLIMPKEFSNREDIIINKPQEQVFNYVKHLKNQNNYGTWNLMDPEIKQIYEGEDAAVGFTVFWESDDWQVGKGNQKIVAIEEGKSMTTEIAIDDYGDPMTAKITTESIGENKTKVTWQNEGVMNYPFNTINLFIDMGDDFEEGLENLKEILEAQETIVYNNELNHLITKYEKSGENLFQAIKGLNEKQLKFKSTDSTWSIGQCADHIIKTEIALTKMLTNALTAAKQTSRDSIQLTDMEVVEYITNREQKAKAPKAIEGENTYETAQSILEDFNADREVFEGLVENYSSEKLRKQVVLSPAGFVDAYQFLLFTNGHTQRHIAQIEEIRTHVDFPQ